MSQEREPWQTSQPSAFPEDEVGMQMPDNGLLDLGEFCVNGWFAPQEGPCGPIMTEKQHAMFRLQPCQGLGYLAKMLSSQPLPLGSLGRQRIGFTYPQAQQPKNDTPPTLTSQ